MSKKVISFSLYGSIPMYCEGAVKNAKIKNSIYGKDWESWFYVYEDVPTNYVNEIKQYADNVIIITKDFYMKNGTFWRFLPLMDNSVKTLITRDLDSRLNTKELHLVNEWLASGKTFHIMRDGVPHIMPFMAGCIGFQKPLPFDFQDLLSKTSMFWEINRYNNDQLFLAHCIYPLTVNNRIVHDTFNHYELDGFRRLERTERFIGEKLFSDGTPDGEKELNEMSNRYIYFYRNIHLYNTEQLGAFLYEFMENLQIARKLKRTLVIPNVFIAPRNNDKILKEKHIYIKSLSCVPITNYIDLSEIDMRYVKLLPLSEFYEKTYESPATVFYNSNRMQNINEYVVDNQLMTAFGKMKINPTKTKIHEFGLHVLSNSTIAMDQTKNIIILENGRLGQPNWHPEQVGLDYFIIRLSLLFHPRLQREADQYVMEKKVRTQSTIMVHWRNGDYTLTNTNQYEKYEDETKAFYQHYVQITNPMNIIVNILKLKQTHRDISQVFLATNNVNAEDLNLFKTKLSQFNISLLEYKNENEQDEGMIQQIIGAQCKYQLHGPSQYERMSAFGRWMIEERKRYYFNEHYITPMEVFSGVYFIENMVST